MTQYLFKIAGTSGSDGLNGCPTLMGVSDTDLGGQPTAPVLDVGDGDLVVQGFKLSPGDRAALGIPDGEDAVRVPRAIILDGARRLTEGE